ncbi:MAG: hypothetical protein PWP65_1147 [Clostridia bacterium]|nr:hypothetical protein [Clostridia bacterium]
MWKNWRQNFGYRIFSILAAVTLWLYVTGEQNPVGQNILSVPLETENLAEGLVVAERPSEIQVRVEGRKNVIARLSPRDIQAVVDLRNARVGENRLPVKVALPEGVNLVNLNPAEVKVRIDRSSEVQLPLKVNLIGMPASGFKTMEPILKPSQVLVSGPEETLRSIGRVFVEADIDQARGHYVAQLPVKVVDRDGRPMQRWVTVKPETAEIFIPVVRDQPSKIVPIRPKLAGEPAKGYVVRRVVLEPEVLEIFGSYELLATIDYLNTMPVEINGARKNIVSETNIDLPPGILLSSFPRVRVVVEIGRQIS